MSRLIRKPSALQLLSINASQNQTEQQALHAEVANIKEALKRSHTAYAMLHDDVERFKGIVRAQDVVLKGLREEVTSLRREIAAPAHNKGVGVVEVAGRKEGAREDVRR